jgi:histone methylation protein DOT1
MTDNLINPGKHALVDDVTDAQPVLDAMLSAVTDGSSHERVPLGIQPGPQFARFVDIGLAMRQMWVDPAQQTALIERLRPLRRLIIGSSPTAIQPHGLLPKGQTTATRLDDIDDDELQQWLIDDNRLIYGEFTDVELAAHVEAIMPYVNLDGEMFDLGSGLGKVVLSAALTLPFERCTGVELLPYRHALAVERRDAVLRARDVAVARLGGTLADDLPLTLSSGVTTSARHVTNFSDRVRFVQQDMFEADLTGASLVFIYSTRFNAMMDRLGEKLARDLPSGCLVSTTTFELTHPAFRLIREFPAQTLAWTTVYLYRREGRLDRLPQPQPRELYEGDAETWEAEIRTAMPAE